MGNVRASKQKKSSLSKSMNEYSCSGIQKKGVISVILPKLAQFHILRNERATLVDSSSIMFGNECLRFVNIAFNASKLFPSIMGTCDAISEYLIKELQWRHPKGHFHIIIAENDGFDFSISSYGHFADIKQEQYRILIFSTGQNKETKMDTHDANSQMKLRWKSVIIKRIDQ